MFQHTSSLLICFANRHCCVFFVYTDTRVSFSNFSTLHRAVCILDEDVALFQLLFNDVNGFQNVDFYKMVETNLNGCSILSHRSSIFVFCSSVLYSVFVSL